MNRRMMGRDSGAISIQFEDDQPGSVPVESFKYTDQNVSLKKFLDHYRKKLPVIARVTEGFCSPDEGKFTFSVEDTYWISHVKTQTRVVGKMAEDMYVSIPADHNMLFQVYLDDGETYGPAKLENILFLTGTDLGSKHIEIDPIRAEEITVWHGADNQDTMRLSRMEIADIYDETYLVGSPIIQKALHDYRCSIPVFVPIKLQTAYDVISEDPCTTFRAEIERLKDVTKHFPNAAAKGSQEIMIFTSEQIDHYGGAYEYIDPYECLSKVQRSGFKVGGGRYNEVIIGPTLPPPDAAPPQINRSNKEGSHVESFRAPAPPPGRNVLPPVEQYSPTTPPVSKVSKDKNVGRPLPRIIPDEKQKDLKDTPMIIRQPSANEYVPEPYEDITDMSRKSIDAGSKPENNKPSDSSGGNKPADSVTASGKATTSKSKTVGPPSGQNAQQKPATSSATKAQPPTAINRSLSEGNDHPAAMYSSHSKKPQPIPTNITLPPEEIERQRQKQQLNPDPLFQDDLDAYHIDNECVYAELANVPLNIDFSKANKMQVSEFLRLLKLHKHIKAFYEQDIDGSLMLDLNKETLKNDFGFTGFEATKLLKFVHQGWRPS